MEKRFPFTVITLIIIYFGNVCVSFAAVLVLKSGKIVEGSIRKNTDQYIEIIVKGESKIYRIEDIENISGKTLQLSLMPKAIDDKDTHSNFIKGMEYAACGKLSDAETMFRNVLETKPSHPGAQEALYILEHVRPQVTGNDYILYLFKGTHHFLNKKYQKSIVAYKKCLQIMPDRFDVYYNLACAYQSLNQHKKAIPYFEKLIKINPRDTDVLANLGVSHYSLDQYKQAIKYWEGFIKIIPDDPDSYSFLGTSYYSTNQHEKGKKCLYKAIQLFKNKGSYQKARDTKRLLDTLSP